MRTGALPGVAVVGLLTAACAAPPGPTSGTDLPDATVVVCGPEGARIDPTVVRPRADGVHLRVENPADEERMLLLYRGGSQIVPPGGTDVVSTAPPGSLRVACVAPGDPEDFEDLDQTEGPFWPYPTEEEWSILEVVDVDGVWTDDTLACEFSTGTHPDYPWEMLEDFPMPEGRTGDPVDLARQDLPGEIGEMGMVGPGDVLEPAGYEGIPGRVRLVRDGETVAVIWYQPDGRGGWHLGGTDYCDDWEPGGPEPPGEVGEPEPPPEEA